LEDILKQILGEIKGLKEGQQKLEDGQHKLEAGQQKLEAGQQQTNQRLSKLEAGQQKLEAGQEKLESRMDNLEVGQQKLENRMDKLETNMENVVNDKIKILFDAFQVNQDKISELAVMTKEGFEKVNRRLDNITEVQYQQAEILKVLSARSIEQEANISYLRKKNFKIRL